MTVYSELLKLRLAEEPDAVGRPLDRLVADLVKQRARLANGAKGPRRRGVREPDPARSVSVSLAYDAALVRLCMRLAVPQRLLDTFPPSDARRLAEQALAVRLPGLVGLDAGRGTALRAVRP